VPYSSNLDVQEDVEKVQKYISDKLLLAFPTLGIENIIDYDSDEDGDLIGSFAVKGSILYLFTIPANTGNPMIQRYDGIAPKDAPEAKK
jgi:hypothetical protein